MSTVELLQICNYNLKASLVIDGAVSNTVMCPPAMMYVSVFSPGPLRIVGPLGHQDTLMEFKWWLD